MERPAERVVSRAEERFVKRFVERRTAILLLDQCTSIAGFKGSEGCLLQANSSITKPVLPKWRYQHKSVEESQFRPCLSPFAWRWMTLVWHFSSYLWLPSLLHRLSVVNKLTGRSQGKLSHNSLFGDPLSNDSRKGNKEKGTPRAKHNEWHSKSSQHISCTQSGTIAAFTDPHVWISAYVCACVPYVRVFHVRVICACFMRVLESLRVSTEGTWVLELDFD